MEANTDVPEAVQEYYNQADALEELADELWNADSIAEDAPVLSELFHEVRTSSRRSRDGRFVALLDLDESNGWECRSVAFLESGAHYRDSGADATVSFKPFPFLPVDQFAEHVSDSLRRDAQAARQSAGNIELQAEEEERRRKIREEHQ